MIRLNKSVPSEDIVKLLEAEKAKKEGTYRHKIILEQVRKDFYDKCYICEQKSLTAINIEHFIPHEGDKDLKFDWNNLYYSCSHCNNTKLAKYKNILSPLSDDVENLISYKYEAFHVHQQVEIKAQQKNPKIEETVSLLNEVYNGTTDIKKLEALGIKKALKKELIDFRQDIDEYEDAIDDDDREEALKHIKRHLHKSSAFAAFKRQYIKDIEYLKKEFGNLLD